MKVQQTNNINFGIRVNTFHIIELTTLKMFEKDGFMGMTNTMKKLYDIPKYTGNKGYRYYAEIVGRKIQKKYYNIAEITRNVNQIIEQNPDMTKNELHNRVCSLINKIGDEIDIEI